MKSSCYRVSTGSMMDVLGCGSGSTTPARFAEPRSRGNGQASLRGTRQHRVWRQSYLRCRVQVLRDGIARPLRLWIRLCHGPQEPEAHRLQVTARPPDLSGLDSLTEMAVVLCTGSETRLVGTIVPDPTLLLYVSLPLRDTDTSSSPHSWFGQLVASHHTDTQLCRCPGKAGLRSYPPVDDERRVPWFG